MAGSLETRVACPLCGGLIHPVAGRCKHCKADLNATRTGRAPAAAPLPPLHARAPISIPLVAATYISPVPIALPTDGSAPFLPPRPTGRSVATVAPSSALRNWPMVVIGLAAVAIIAAVAIMVWPASKKTDPSRALQPPPAPERMDSDPLPPPGAGNTNGADPWAGHSQVTPQPRRTPDPLPPEPPPSNRADPDPADPNGLGGFGGLTLTGTDMMMAAMGHACARLKTCPTADESVRDMCDMLSHTGRTPAAPSCDAAKECLDAIDKLDCNQAATPAALLSTIPSCLRAETSC